MSSEQVIDFRAVFEALPTPFLLLRPDAKFTILYVNQSYLAAGGVCSEELIGHGLFDLFPDNLDNPAGSGVSDLRASLQRVLKDKTTDYMGIQRYDVRSGLVDGSEERYWNPINVPVLDTTGAIACILHRVEDVTEFMVAMRSDSGSMPRSELLDKNVFHAANELKEANRQLNAANLELARNLQELEEVATLKENTKLLGMTHAFVRELVGGKIPYWSSGAASLYGYSAEEAVGAVSNELLRTRFPKPLADIEAEVIERGEWQGELIHTTKDGRQLSVASHWVFLAPDRILEVNNDITDQKRTEQKLRKREIELFRLTVELEKRVAERTAGLVGANKELEAFSYSVSHDLRAPLRALEGFSQLLSTNYAQQLDEQGQHYLARIRAGAIKMSDLINDLLKLSRVSRFDLNREPVDLAQLACEAVEELRRREPNRRIEAQIDGPMVVNGDRHLLRIAIDNLVDNAWKFTARREEAVINFSSVLMDGRRVYRVRDNGAGFEGRYASRLFKPFQRLHDETEFPGTGIGLATVQRVITRHGGEVWAEGEPDKGATFWFSLGDDNAPTTPDHSFGRR